ncbi:hypothetical protein HDC92_003300 [Pedobacter sp. AK017]|uniref:hypothetical protein n=1 Tax=Pedobacter sp. AK017 TaxID=2723073 RepID=UPI0016208ABA|nr:hypothetical protein [Pedobacter sp. AK017]MBB5439607.1 hypothetical protein [Pedobacter sp. AK017]
MRQKEFAKKRNIRPEKVVSVLEKYDRKITLAEAELILELSYKFAILCIEQVKNGGSENPSPKRMTPRNLYR